MSAVDVGAVGSVVSISSSGGFSTSIGSSEEPLASAACCRRRAALRASARWRMRKESNVTSLTPHPAMQLKLYHREAGS